MKKNKFIVLGLLPILLFSPMLSAKSNSDEVEILAVIQKFFRGTYLAKAQDLQQSTLDFPGRENLISRKSRSPAERQELEQQIRQISLPSNLNFTQAGLPLGKSDSLPQGARSVALIDFRGAMLVVIQKESQGWKVDPRYALAAKKQLAEDSPEINAKKFLYALFQKDRKSLKNLVTDPGKVDELIQSNRYPGGDLDQLLSLCLEMPVTAAMPGESFRLPSGEVKQAKASVDEALVLGLYGTVELVFALKKIEGQWKVIPQPYLEMMQAMGAI